MNWFEALLLGLLQGLTECLPISSSAHMRIFGPLISGGDPGAAFSAIIQLGTEVAVLIYFRKDLWLIASSWLRSLGKPFSSLDGQAKMGWFIIIGTLPILVLGWAFAHMIETSLRNLYLTASMLAAFALLFGLADIKGRKHRTIADLTWKHAIIFGLMQAMALIPGVSRSGGTITCGLMLGYTREASARYSFLLAIPAVAASGLYQLFKAAEHSTPIAAGPTILATLVAFASYCVIAVFMRWISSDKSSYMPFVIYRILLSALVFVMLGFGILQP